MYLNVQQIQHWSRAKYKLALMVLRRKLRGRKITQCETSAKNIVIPNIFFIPILLLTLLYSVAQLRDLAKHIEAHSKKHNAYKKKNVYDMCHVSTRKHYIPGHGRRREFCRNNYCYTFIIEFL